MRKCTPPIVIALALAMLVALPAWARNPVLETDASSDAAKTGGALLSSTDPVCLYAEDFSQGEAGWTPRDLSITQDGIFWQRTAYAPGGFGSRGVMWCGTYIAGDPLNPAGYGNFWLQYLTKPFQLPAWNASIEFSIQYDTETSYDFVNLQGSTDGGATWTEWMSLTGRSMDIDVDDGVRDGFITYNVDLNPYTNQNVLIRFMFVSDTNWSDADLLYPTDGACRLDWVRVSGYATDDFESSENGWVASIPVAEPAVFRLVDRPVCTNPALPCDSYCNTWVAYDPVTGVFPWRDDLASMGGANWLAIESPTIALPGDATTYWLDFDVYCDLPLDNLVFFSWQVAAPASGAFRSNSALYYNNPASSRRHMHIDITRYVRSGATSIRVRLVAIDGKAFYGGSLGTGANHTPAPFFDNVQIIALGTNAPGIDVSGFPAPCGNTSPGTDVVVNPVDPTTGTQPVTLTFDSVVGTGTTTVETSGTGSPPPAGFRLGNPPIYYEIQTTADYTGAIDVCVDYAAAAFGNESNLRIFHMEGGSWVDRTASLDTAGDVICAQVTSLSPFLVCEPEPLGDISGFVRADCPQAATPLPGVAIDAFEVGTGLMVAATVTNADGYFVIEDVPATDYTVTIVTPLGYSAAAEEVTVTVPGGGVASADYQVACLTIAAHPRGMGYWKHQVAVATGARGTADIDGPTLCGYFDLIETHFNSNRINPILIYEPPASGACSDVLEVARRFLNLKGSAAMVDRAKQHFTALLLNVASGNISLRHGISADGATVSQAITYCDRLIMDGDTSNDEVAKDVADLINNGLTVPRNTVPLTTPDIAYSPGRGNAGARELVLLPNSPNPFNPTTAIQYELPNGAHVQLAVYDVAGRQVRLLESGHRAAGHHDARWDGRTDDGMQAVSGVYWLRLQAGQEFRTIRMVLLK